MASRTTVVGGTPMRWVEYGEGYPVVFVHGIPTSPALWRRVIPYVDERSLAWEMVGYGESIPEGEGRDISMAAQGRFLLDWCDEMGLDRAVFVGHDLGGGVVLRLAVAAPHRCAGLVLTNSIAYDSWPIPSVKAMRAMAPLVARAPMWVLRAPLATLFWRGHDDRELAREGLSLHLEPYTRLGGAAALARQVQALDVRDTLEVMDAVRALRLPAQVVWGASDQFQKLHYGELLARDLAAPLVTVEEGKHFMPEDHPTAIAGAVRDVVDAARAGTTWVAVRN